MSRYEKLFVALKYFLVGRKYVNALRALEFARHHHSGMRKDGETREFQHQLEICMYLTTLKDVQNEEKMITVALLHDIMEDYNIPVEEMEAKFGKDVTECVWLLTKKYKNQKKDIQAYFQAIGSDPIASLVKGADRIHNVQTMIDVFSTEKQLSYLLEVETYFLPMIKQAKYKFPEQAPAYFNIQHMLQSQVKLIKAIHRKDRNEEPKKPSKNPQSSRSNESRAPKKGARGAKGN